MSNALYDQRVDRRLGLDESRSRSSSVHGSWTAHPADSEGRPSDRFICTGRFSEENAAPSTRPSGVQVSSMAGTAMTAAACCTPVREAPCGSGGNSLRYSSGGGQLTQWPPNVPSVPPNAPLSVTPTMQVMSARDTAPLGGGGGSYGASNMIFASQMYTPQVPAVTLAMRAHLDTVLDLSNSEHRHSLNPPVTPLIEGQLYLGGDPSDEVLRWLAAEGVHCIVNCCSQDCPVAPAVRENWYVYELQACDSPDYYILLHDYDAFAHTVGTALSNGEKVYVHCIAGINRSVTLCAAFLMERFLLAPLEVVRVFHDSGRRRILENTGFRQQLVDHYLQYVQPRQC